MLNYFTAFCWSFLLLTGIFFFLVGIGKIKVKETASIRSPQYFKIGGGVLVILSIIKIVTSIYLILKG